ncbi:translation initiation factor IF-1 [Verrucomicrobia bacterium S94]|nr:translation initiation factor IF-1 [Verrucomicrobia bacterium S94]
MDKKETILLEACVVSVIDKHAFDAELINGHRFVAFLRRDDFKKKHPQVGAKVMVEMSPYDMSKGRLIIDQEQNNESTSFSKKNV